MVNILKTLRRLYEKNEHILTGEPDGRISDEDVPGKSAEVCLEETKRPPYRERWRNKKRDEIAVKEQEKPEDYSDKVKDVCFICGHHIKKSLERYMKSGNTCVVCNNRANRVMKGVITHEEAIEELLLRRKV